MTKMISVRVDDDVHAEISDLATLTGMTHRQVIGILLRHAMRLDDKHDVVLATVTARRRAGL